MVKRAKHRRQAHMCCLRPKWQSGPYFHVYEYLCHPLIRKSNIDDNLSDLMIRTLLHVRCASASLFQFPHFDPGCLTVCTGVERRDATESCSSRPQYSLRSITLGSKRCQEE